MRNIWIFLNKYNAILIFLLFFILSLGILVKNNAYQRASVWNSSNEWVGRQYEKITNLKNYLRLKEINESLEIENARLRNQIPQQTDSLGSKIVTDTVNQKQFTYLAARVINNSIRQKNNYLTINRGYNEGIRKGMGVVGPDGIVGIVINVSAKYATIQSLLHSETRISASLANSKAFGSLVWGSGNFDSRYAILQDVPNHIKVKKGEAVVTSGYSLFPAGIAIGRVAETGLKGGESFFRIKVLLSTNFATLSYVYVVKNSEAVEQSEIESLNKTE